jgi:hypothetical protein
MADPKIVLKNMADDDAAMVKDAIDEAGIRPEIVERA